MDPKDFLKRVVLAKLNEARKMALIAYKGGMSAKAAIALVRGNCQGLLTMLDGFTPEEGSAPLPMARVRKAKQGVSAVSDGAT